ncbi:MAG: alginate export family protein [Methylobacter sp.]|nr:alginate export family protein [Methylobacter sp.]
MRRIPLAGVAVSHTLILMVAGGFCMGGCGTIQAAEKKKYSKPPIAPFSSQMQDALLGSDQYEKPVWNLHDTLGLPKWLSMSLEQQRTRYETMDGARHFDYGPTGIYGAFARSNVNTPGYRIGINPRSDVQAFLSHRAFRPASSKDNWTTANLQDKTGRSGDFVGHQLELSTRWDVNSSLNLETGWAHLFKGEFAKNAPSAPNAQDVDYFYVQSMLRF